jgi:hypothetical protein
MIDDDDIDDDGGVHLEHVWTPDGHRDTGEPRERCVRCGTAQHWPAGRVGCVVVLAHVAMVDVATEPLREGQWPGPYSVEAPRECQFCGHSFKRPVTHGATRSCSPVCSREVKLATNRRLRAEARAAKQGA